MGKELIPIQLEQIRKVKKDTILLKVSEMPNTSIYVNGEFEEVEAFLSHGLVPENHYLVIDRPIINRLNGETWFGVYMITHSPEYNNILIKKEWVQNFTLHQNSHITIDTFVIRKDDIIMDEQYGAFDLETFKAIILH
jgi:hypothetical protein